MQRDLAYLRRFRIGSERIWMTAITAFISGKLWLFWEEIKSYFHQLFSQLTHY